MRKIILYAILAMLLAGSVFVWLTKKHNDRTRLDGRPETAVNTTVKKAVRESGRPRPVARSVRPAIKKTGGDNNGDTLPSSADTVPVSVSDEERFMQIISPLQAARDADDTQAILAEARKLMGHEDPEVRKEVVTSLGVTGLAGFPDLVKMLLDEDPEVSRAALEAWELEMGMIESTDEKVAMAKAVGEIAIEMDPASFQEVLGAMIDVPDEKAVVLLADFAALTDDPEILDAIFSDVNFRIQPEESVESKEDIPKAIEEYLNRQAQENNE